MVSCLVMILERWTNLFIVDLNCLDMSRLERGSVSVVERNSFRAVEAGHLTHISRGPVGGRGRWRRSIP